MNLTRRAALVGVLLAVLAGFGWQAVPSHAYLIGSDTQSDFNTIAYHGRWWPWESPYAGTEHVAHFCFDGRNNSNAYGTITQAWVDAEAYEWTNISTSTFIFVDDGPCAPSSTACNNNYDGVSRIYFINDSNNTNLGLTCSHWNDANSSAKDGRMLEADIYINLGAAPLNIAGNCTNTTLCANFSGLSLFETYAKGALVHEFGHMMGLAHDCPVDGTASIMCTSAAADYTLNTNFAAPQVDDRDCQHRPHNQLPLCLFPTTDDIAGLKAIYADRDHDGCVGLEEAGPNAALGGGRFDIAGDDGNLDDAWRSGRFEDFADVDGDKQVSILDIGAAADWYTHNVTANGGDAPNRMDVDGDGSVSILDLADMSDQSGNSCVGGP